MMCLPRKVTLMIDPRHIWNVSYKAQSNRTHPPTSPNIAPATQNDSHEWCPSHMKRHLQCAGQQVSSTNVTKYCACHEKWPASLILVTYETSFTMRGATGITLQPHQMLCLPRKMTRIIDPRDIWNIIYNARSNRHHLPTSPNTAPATQNCTPKSKKNLPKTVEASIPMRGQFDHDPNPTRTWSDREIPKLNPSVRRAYFFPPRQRILYWKLQHFALRLSTQISANAAPATKNDTARSPNTATATKSDSHEWCPSHLKRHLQCAEQQDSSSNVTKYCTCHVKWLSWVMSVTYETSFTMRGATSLALQPHQMLRLPRKMTRMIDPRDIWNVIYNARSNRHHLPTSPNTAPATQNCTPKSKKNLPKTVEASIPMRGRFDHDPNMIRPWNSKTEPVRSQSLLFPPRQRILYWKLQHFALRLSTQISANAAPATKNDTARSPNTAPATKSDSHEWCPSHLKRHLQCAEQQDSSSNVTKYCACHEKWDAWLILVTYETSFTMRGATSLTLQPHQMLRLPRKMGRMIDPRDIWNVIYNARNNRHHPPTSPNTAPATQNCIPKSKKNLPKTVEASIPMRGRFDHDPTMIRPWTRHLAPARSRRLLLALRRRILYWKLQHFTLRLSTQISPNTVPATKSDTPTSPNAAPATKSDTPRSPNTAPATKSRTPRSPNAAPAMKSDTELLLDCTLTCYLTWIVALLSCYLTELSEQLLHCFYLTEQLLHCCYFTELLLYWAVTFLSCYCTELLLYWTVTLLSCYFPELLLYRAVTWLSCYLTELLLYWTVTLLSCYFPELLLYWAVSLLSCYFTELLLYWAVSLLSCYFTELLLYWAVTWLNCYLTELLLCWTVTLLSCYFTELLLYWAVSLLSCYFTELLLQI